MILTFSDIKHLFILVFLSINPHSNNTIATQLDGYRIFHPNPFNLEPSFQETMSVDFNDSLSDNTLHICRSEEGFPIFYFRMFRTGVCIKNECRLLQITLYWTMTGRYLGYELSKGEFLSKTEHVKFSDEEYEKMHLLLSNPYSLLANFTLEQLATENKSDVDAVTAATITDILSYTIKDAVYTSYTIWHLVYGDTRRKIIKQTERELTVELLEVILMSSNMEDKIWGLYHIWGYVEPTQKIYDILFAFIQSSDTKFASMAVDVIPLESLGGTDFEKMLENKIDGAAPYIQSLIIKKLQFAKQQNQIKNR